MTDLDKILTDEMFAAYIDGNAIPIERAIIEGHLRREDLQEVLDIVADLKDLPELIDSGENMDSEKPDSNIVQVEPSLQELKKNIEGNNQHIM